MNTYFISDLHFGHANVIRYDNRPFVNIEHNDSVLIKNWNSRVTDEDEVYILGDFSWYNATKTLEIFSKLKGKKFLIRGNHDGKLLKNSKVRSLFEEIVDYKEIKLTKDFGLVLSHYPIPCFNHHIQGWVHLYGHVHNAPEWNIMLLTKETLERTFNAPCRMYNIGCMLNYMGYTPRTLEEILSTCEN